MSDDDVVRRAREALDGITPGKWEADHYFHRKTHAWTVSEVDPVSVVEGNGDGGIRTSKADADFIATAPDLVRELCAEVEKMRAEVQRQREGDWSKLSRTLHNAETERDRLRTAVAQVRTLANSDLMVSPHELRHALDGGAQ